MDLSSALLWAQAERTGLDGKAPHSFTTCTFPWMNRQAENGVGTNAELKK